MQTGKNKIFVEGDVDKNFVDAILNKHFVGIEDSTLVVSVGGKDKLKKAADLNDDLRKKNDAKNLLIVDTDYVAKGGGRERRLQEYNTISKELGVDFKIYLLPNNDETEGEIEDLIITCFKKEFDFFDGCWRQMVDCFGEKQNEIDLNLPATKGFLYSKADLLKNITKDRKSINFTAYDYTDTGIWNLEIETNPHLKKLVDFIKENLFDE